MSKSGRNDITLTEEEEEEMQHNLDLDTILVNDLGKFGKFQLRVTVLCSLAAILSPWAAAEYMFTTARIKTRCLIPECDSHSPEFYPSWVYNAIPESSGSLDTCKRFTGNSSQLSREQTCPAELFNRNATKDCTEYIYENKNTVVYDFGLACDEWSRTLIGSVRMFGCIMSLLLTGFISDRWGRRIALTITGFCGAWLGAARYFVNTYVGFMVLQIVEATVSTGFFTSAFILLVEVLGVKYRTIAGTIMLSFWAVGHLTLSLIAQQVPNWRNLTLALFLPQLSTISLFWLLSESARWYIAHGRFAEAEAVLKKRADTNGENFCLNLVEALRPREKIKPSQGNGINDVKEPWLIVLLFKYKKVLLTCMVASVWWMTSTLIYYGLSINAVNMTGNPYLNYAICSIVEVPGCWIAAFLMARIGRKPVLAGGFWACAICQVAYIFIPPEYHGLSLTFYFIGKCSISNVIMAQYIYTAELYPTRHRQILFAFNSMSGKVGAIVAPITPAIGVSTFVKFPFVLFGALSLLAGMLVFITPETLGTKLPDTMEEAENLLKTKPIPRQN